MNFKHRPFRFALLRPAMAALGGLLSVASAAETVEDRMAALEKRLGAVEAENVRLRRQVGSTETTMVTAAGRESKLALGGFVQAHFESGGAPDARYNGINDRFLLRRARVNFTGSFVEHASFKVEADFGNNSISAKSGSSGQLTDVYASYTKFPAASLRMGQFKTPFGFEQLTSDTKTLTVERALPNDRLTLGRQIGGMLYGDVAAKRVSYSIGAFNGNGTNIGSNDNQKFMWVGRTTAIVHDGAWGEVKSKLTLGANAFTTEDKGTFSGRRTGWGVDSQFVVGPAELQGEWLRVDQDPVTGRPTAADGWALLGAISITRRLQGVVRYESYDSNVALPDTTSRLWTLGFNYRLKGDDLKIAFNYLIGEPPGSTPAAGRFLGRMQVAF